MSRKDRQLVVTKGHANVRQLPAPGTIASHANFVAETDLMSTVPPQRKCNGLGAASFQYIGTYLSVTFSIHRHM